jgi:hypothetical protein
MRKKTLPLLAVCMVALVGLSFLTWNLLNPQIAHKYERNISRNFSNQQEENALTAAETINYSAITALERFDASSDPEAFVHSDTSYTFVHFIDSEVINYYETRYDKQQGKEHPSQIELTYQANVTKYSQLRIYNSPAPEGVSWHNITVVMSTTNGSTVINSGNMQFYYKNQSSYQMTQWNYDFNFSDCLVVEMKLVYSETYAPLAAFFASVDQIMVLDRNLEPVLLGLESGMAVA